MERSANLSDSPSWASTLLALLLMAVAFVPIVLWPSEVSWCIDEPRLIANAWHANNDREMATCGLFGNFAVPYGPVPTQIYQVILAISHDPGTIVLLRALFVAGITAFSLLWLARTLALPQWFAAAFLLAPYVSLQQRILWDASFTIPFGTLALASLASFLRYRGKWPLRITLFMSALVFVIHPQSIPLAIPILGFLLWKHRGAMRSDARGMLWTAGAFLALHAKYFIIGFGALMYRLQHAPVTAYPDGQERLKTALAPLLGGNLFNGHHGALPDAPPWLGEAAAWCSMLIYPLIWLGILFALARLPRIFRSLRAREPLAARDTMSTLGLVCLVVQAALYGVLRIPSGPQYFFGTFALHAFFAWLGVTALRDIRPLRGAAVLPGVLYLVACALITIGSAIYNHQHALDKPAWPTMKNAAQVVRALNQYEELGAWSDINYGSDIEKHKINFKKFPQILRTIRLLIPPDGTPQRRSEGGLFITFRRENGVQTGEMIVQELGKEKPPEGAYYFNVAPLPKQWDPDPSTW